MISGFFKPSRPVLSWVATMLPILIYACWIENLSKATAQELTIEPKTTTGTMQLSVVGPDGNRLAGAKIHQSAVWSKERLIVNREYVCDDNGQVNIELPKTLDILRLWARKDGFVPLFVHWEQFEPGPIPKEFNLKMTKGTVIGGFVKDEDGKPIAGVKVGVRCSTSDGERNRISFSDDLADKENPCITDAQGRWSLDNVPQGNEIKILISLNHPEYISDLTWGGLQEMQNIGLSSLRGQKSAITMYRGIALTGVVTDPNGNPISGAVVVWGDDPYDQTGRHQEHQQEVRTDAKGVYQLPPLPPMTITVTVAAKDWAPDLKKVKITRVNPKADFQLKPGKTLNIKFVDDKGKPIPGVYVGIDGWRGVKSLYNVKHPIVLETKIPDKADKNGIYQWTWAPVDEVFYNFGKQGYIQIESKGMTADGSEQEIRLYK